MFACACLVEECVERVVTSAHCLVRRHLSVRLYAVLQTVQFPACIADLHARLTDMYADAFALKTSSRRVGEYPRPTPALRTETYRPLYVYISFIKPSKKYYKPTYFSHPHMRKRTRTNTPIASHRIASHRIASHRIASHRIASHRIASHRIASHRIASHRLFESPICSSSNKMNPVRLIYTGRLSQNIKVSNNHIEETANLCRQW